MKKIFLLLIAVLALQSLSFSQSEKFSNAMKQSLALFDSAKTVEDFTRVANNFQRIGDAEKSQWLPYYYAALSLSNAGWMPSVGDVDKNAEQTKALCDKAEALTTSDTDKAEINAVRYMALTQQMTVDPQNRYMSYGMEANRALQKGMLQDPGNPRLYYLEGAGLFNTPPQFGGGKDKAKPVFEKALDLFKKQIPKELYPSWGLKQTETLLAQCQ